MSPIEQALELAKLALFEACRCGENVPMEYWMPGGLGFEAHQAICDVLLLMEQERNKNRDKR